MSSEVVAGIIGGALGGVLGVVGTMVTSYYGPRKLEEMRERKEEERRDGPRKALLLKLLEDPKHKGRSLELLSRVTGTTDEECRRLLIELDARGMKFKRGKEGWGLISRNPFKGE